MNLPDTIQAIVAALTAGAEAQFTFDGLTVKALGIRVKTITVIVRAGRPDKDTE